MPLTGPNVYSLQDDHIARLSVKYFTVFNNKYLPNGMNKLQLNPKFHWLHQITTTLREFQWRFWIFWTLLPKLKNSFINPYEVARFLKFAIVAKFRTIWSHCHGNSLTLMHDSRHETNFVDTLEAVWPDVKIKIGQNFPKVGRNVSTSCFILNVQSFTLA